MSQNILMATHLSLIQLKVETAKDKTVCSTFLLQVMALGVIIAMVKRPTAPRKYLKETKQNTQTPVSQVWIRAWGPGARRRVMTTATSATFARQSNSVTIWKRNVKTTSWKMKMKNRWKSVPSPAVAQTNVMAVLKSPSEWSSWPPAPSSAWHW